LQEVQQKYGDKIAVLAVVNHPDDPSTVNAFLSSHKINYPILFDSGQMAYSYVLNQTLSYPQLFVIDGEGIIRAEYEYSPVTREIFEGNGLGPAIRRFLSK
jgi:peroxiredoxin